METVYEEILEIANSIFIVEAENVEIGEMVCVDKKDGTKLYGQVISFDKTKVTVQAMGDTRGLCTGDKTVFLKKKMRTVVGDGLLGRVLSARGKPLDDGPLLDGLEVEIGTPTANPVRRIVPHRMIQTYIPMIDIFNSLVESQKLPIFTVPGEPYNELLMRIANHTDADVIIIGIMGARLDDMHAFIDNTRNTGALNKTVMFVHKATDYPAECLLVPDMALTAAEQFAQKGKRVLVLLTDMTAYADALKEIAISLNQIPSNRGYPGSLYSDLAFRYEKAIDIQGAGSITLLPVVTMPGDDVTHPIPDNTGYITEGQFYLRNGRIEPFGSLSRLKQFVVDEVTREDHGAIMNTMIRLYSEALKSRELYSMGFKLSKWDEKLLKYSEIFENEMMDLGKSISLIDGLDLGWKILAQCFEKVEVGIKDSLLEKFWIKEGLEG
ncbi:MAG: V-type sodium ATPase subunit B [Chlamydiia bacterium]|nr:V-type sodium ATPase subunit B [Chlamydiia bacterium]MCH9618611.1 V-type sodium ATPase subunit B [Chlamydiia bacterium]MCH9624331.1 V-type sodium ATPase subunit B [Chlamydiia bacterium]